MQVRAVLMMQDDFTKTVQPVSSHDFMFTAHALSVKSWCEPKIDQTFFLDQLNQNQPSVKEACTHTESKLNMSCQYHTYSIL